MTVRRAKQASAATEEITAAAPPPLPTQNQDLYIPLSSQAVFWRPHHTADSPMLGQLPFLFWLTGTIRPRLIVQLGIGDGVVYMGLCQASERLGDSAICMGIQAGTSLMPAAMRAQHDAKYSDFSQFIDGDLATAPHRVDGEIDLLVLNQPLEVGDLARLQSDWLPRLSDRAVILACHPDAVFPDPAARESLLPRLHRSILIGPVSTGGHAMEVILHGKDQAERLRALAAQSPGTPAYLGSRQVFNRLGQGIEAIQKAEDFQKERDSLRSLLQSTEATLKTSEAELGDQRAEVSAARAAEAAEVSRQAEILARQYDLEQLLSEKTREATALVSERTRIEARIKELEDLGRSREAEHKSALEAARAREEATAKALRSELEALGAGKSALEAQLVEARNAHEARIKEMEDLARSREVEHKRALEAARSQGEVSTKALRSRVEGLEAEKTALEAQLAKALNSQAERSEDIVFLTERYDADAIALKNTISSLKAQIAEAQTNHAGAFTALQQQISGLVIGLGAHRSNALWKKGMSLSDQAKLLLDSKIIDPDWYLTRHPDVAAAGHDPVVHYLLHGASEGREARPLQAGPARST